MKVLFSQLQKYLPNLKDDVAQVAEVFTMIGFMQDGPIEKVEYMGKEDFMLDLEVRQNRADLLGVIGLARELSAYYGIEMNVNGPRENNFEQDIKIEDLNNDSPKGSDFIEVKAKDAVKRVLSIKISNLKVSESPSWLKHYLELYGINSINNLVDLTNYVMLETSHASHAFDEDLMNVKKLVWEIDLKNHKKIITLDGSEVELNNESLVISDGEEALSLAIIGGKRVGITKKTKNIILEMAVYDGGLVRRNGRKLMIATEAGSRLEKFQDPETVPHAFEMLVNLIIENCDGEITSQLTDVYLQKYEKNEIEVNLEKVSQIGGMQIEFDESLDYLEKLGFEVLKKDLPMITVKRPNDRLDVEQEEDVFEEIIRLKGFYNIPKNRPNMDLTPDLTKPHLKLIDEIKLYLKNNGFDEVRSWVLVDQIGNELNNHLEENAIKVVNSINDEVPFLRNNLSVSLLKQFASMQKSFIKDIQIFEIGKIFFEGENSYNEKYFLGLLRNENDLNLMRQQIQKLLNSVGYENVRFLRKQSNFESAHENNVFEISIFDVESFKFVKVGVMYLTNKFKIGEEVSVCELNIEALSEFKNLNHSTQEVEQKIVSLDQNIEILKSQSINEVLQDYLNKIEDNLWSFEIVDSLENAEKIKYTVRISYFDLNDKEAKEVHKRVFEL